MDNSFKKVIKLKSTSEVEGIIENWANEYGFKHDSEISFPNIDDMAYTFSLKDDDSKTIVYINILDEIVYIETIAVKSSFQSKLSKTAIGNLLEEIKKVRR